jgi:isonocardicin synthase
MIRATTLAEINAEMNHAAPEVAAAERRLLDVMQVEPDGPARWTPPAALARRPTRLWREPVNRFPQNVFLVETGGATFVGRKLMSSFAAAGQLLEPHCSRIVASHLLGRLRSFHTDEDGVSVYYHSLRDSEKRALLARLAADPLADIVFPFAHLVDGCERCSLLTGWSLDPGRAANLAIGEQHLREFSIALVRQHGAVDPVLYDPACATGDFLRALKEAFPRSVTIGQDLSLEMIGYARPRLDRAYCGDAMSPRVADGSADFVFCRFLNSEVVTCRQASALLARLSATVKPGGYLVVFGHTPVLVQASEILACGDFRLVRTLGATEDRSTVFQYYVARRGSAAGADDYPCRRARVSLVRD